MKILKLDEELRSMSYHGRGIIIGKSDCGEKAVVAYFIMGRSENSRNRIFKKDGDGIKTEAFDDSKISDPSLIIYPAVRVLGNKTIVTNGDQTETIYKFMDQQLSFEQALRCRDFEPDKPNYTPRISGIVHIPVVKDVDFNYALSIIKSGDGCADSVYRFNYAYNNPCSGKGHFIHTYKCDANPLPSFEGEPKSVEIKGNIDDFTSLVWESLNPDNKISLFTRFIDKNTGQYESRIINKNKLS